MLCSGQLLFMFAAVDIIRNVHAVFLLEKHTKPIWIHPAFENQMDHALHFTSDIKGERMGASKPLDCQSIRHFSTPCLGRTGLQARKPQKGRTAIVHARSIEQDAAAVAMEIATLARSELNAKPPTV